jgi:hypothetical protein
MENLSPYEKEQLREIELWKTREPSVLNKGLDTIIRPVVWLAQSLIPPKAIESALRAASNAGRWLADSNDLLRDACVSTIAELRHKDLTLSDGLADNVRKWAIGMATVEGGATGWFGVFGAPVDVPAIITLAMRTIFKIGLCYGYESKGAGDLEFVRGVLAASSANSQEEKYAALAALRSLEVAIARQTWKAMAEKAAQAQFSKEGGIIAVRTLARELGVNITKRRAAAAIPVFGLVVGAAVNAWFVDEVGWAARRSFQERWLRENGKIIDVEPESRN